MKTKIFLTLAMSLGLAAASQAQTTFGVRAGGSFFNITGDNAAGNDLEGKLKPGFQAGVNVEFPVGTDFYLQPGLLFSQKGSKQEDGDGKINLSYVELPINFIYKPELGAGKMLLGFGPYFAVAAGGSLKPDGGGDDIDFKFKSDLTTAEALSGTPYLKRYDAGGNLLVGYEFANKLSFQLNAQLGLLKINPSVNDEDGETKWKNTGFGLSVGYRF